jgi:hypothetical protein
VIAYSESLLITVNSLDTVPRTVRRANVESRDGGAGTDPSVRLSHVRNDRIGRIRRSGCHMSGTTGSGGSVGQVVTCQEQQDDGPPSSVLSAYFTHQHVSDSVGATKCELDATWTQEAG